MAQKFGNFKIYFPNIIFKIIPDPRLSKNQAAFRVPLNVNKFDIRDYLTNIYNVTVTDVRTAVLPGKWKLNHYTGRKERTARTKKAIVTMKEEFTYPSEPDVDKDFGGLETRMHAILSRNRMKGWNYRPSMELLRLREQVKEQKRENAK
ncbi:mitochondrial 54S ribosomal protein YmL41 [Coemansia brasiliensis]|uniref:Large ribosomal subunit protein uL23m n=1 Tax=Coemansia brasiliensis TaxID=2650707 RepID=A0A9W8IA21_9FUNG|nr:mitochondrial 54S ribosomal protein YmL41 [Coemansia brasiliensis]